MKFQVKHGMARTRLYGIWRAMKKRCSLRSHPRYAEHGGRGITVCMDWLVFETFMRWAQQNGYADDLSIDRLDNDRGYEPGNCRWASVEAQAHNRRGNDNITFEGKTQPLRAWVRELGLKRSTVQVRMKRGMTFEEAIR